ncbi:MAG: hypothetical protein KIS66_14380 [Fimbriimonadaceae bacterium]|nr:hypothetical protein [Fimbriimonadaceae bacterium]
MRRVRKRLTPWLGTIALVLAVAPSGALPTSSPTIAPAVSACGMPCCQGPRPELLCCASRATIAAKPLGCGCEIRAAAAPSPETTAPLTSPPVLVLPLPAPSELVSLALVGEAPLLPSRSAPRIRSPDSPGHPLRAPPAA